ncbi:polysaccharide deacetylase family protein [Paenibacillus sp. IB182496]|uniref:Polysaccharide deacetylase family protein n=1 Tax=Paenibacillus sabuli TaxID=2772509 RepID=A0A927BWQ7_9BACL|nr:polysaccharide deacetylase family protein [Paenibacillus sabuli]MBD2847145.1 polysaccharide deacetylase family protein [Paenibacillus sabuli]
MKRTMKRGRGLLVFVLGGMLMLGACAAATSDSSPDAESQTPAGKRDNHPGAQARTPRGALKIKSAAPEKQTPDLSGGSEKKTRDPKPMTLAELRSKYPSTFLLQGPAGSGKVALTFDDAPDKTYTPMVLDALKKAGIQATFFVVGNRIEAHPYVMRRIVAEGHVVGNHSYSHANLPKLSDKRFREEITRTDKLIKQYTGYTPTYVRPPYGNINESQLQWLASQHRKIINWNVDSLDWKGLSADEVATNVLADSKPGAIILQHSGGGVGEDLSGTVKALPRIIARLREEGVGFATIPGLLGLP